MLRVNSLSGFGSRAASAISTDTGWTSPGTVVEDALGGVGFSWSNESNATASDDSDASSTIGTGNFSRYLVATNFSISLPSGSTIDGVEVRWEGSAGNSAIQWSQVTLVDTGPAKLGTEKTPGTSIGLTDTLYTAGSSSDGWGASLTEAAVEDTDFGFGIRFENTDNFVQFTIDVDHMQMKVHYTA